MSIAYKLVANLMKSRHDYVSRLKCLLEQVYMTGIYKGHKKVYNKDKNVEA